VRYVSLTLFVILSAAIYRLARFLILDELIEELRDSFHAKLTEHPNRLTIKVQILMLCPHCLTIWVSGAVLGYWYTLGERGTWWAFPVYLLDGSTGALVFWHYIDAKD
jgi:hypothetical protein